MALSWTTILAAATLLAARSAADRIDEGKYSPIDIIVKDVVILGGGASGSYAAVRLKDQGKSVIVVEQKDHLVCCPYITIYSEPLLTR